MKLAPGRNIRASELSCYFLAAMGDLLFQPKFLLFLRTQLWIEASDFRRIAVTVRLKED